MLLVGIIDTGLARNLFERSVATIAKQEIGFAFHVVRCFHEHALVAEGKCGIGQIVHVCRNVACHE